MSGGFGAQNTVGMANFGQIPSINGMVKSTWLLGSSFFVFIYIFNSEFLI